MDELNQKIKEYAIKSGIFVDFRELKIDKIIGSGIESDVYALGKYVIKLSKTIFDMSGNKCSKVESYRVDRIIGVEREIQKIRYKMHNKFFPETKIDVIGMTEYNGFMCYILKQKYIKVERKAEQWEIDVLM